MKMTIDNAISAIEMGQIQLEMSQQPRSIALDTAISTMRKYQKIEQIIADYEENKWERIDVKDIREIIDGNNSR